MDTNKSPSLPVVILLDPVVVDIKNGVVQLFPKCLGRELLGNMISCLFAHPYSRLRVSQKLRHGLCKFKRGGFAKKPGDIMFDGLQWPPAVACNYRFACCHCFQRHDTKMFVLRGKNIASYKDMMYLKHKGKEFTSKTIHLQDTVISLSIKIC